MSTRTDTQAVAADGTPSHFRWFGQTVLETADALRSTHLGGASSHKGDQRAKAWFRIVISAALFCAGMYLIGNPATRTEGTSILGSLTGYWLK